MNKIVSLFTCLHLATGLIAGTLHVVPADQPITDPANQFHSLQDAINASRDPGNSETIRIHPGEYFATAATLNEKDTGLSIEGAGDQTVLYGGIQLTEWQSVDSPILAKTGWVMVKLPPNASNIRVLEIEGVKRPRARLPQEGRLTHLSKFEGRWQSTASGGFDVKPTHEQLTRFVYKTGELGDWPGITNGEVTLFHSWDETLVSITGVDAESRTVRYTPESGYPPGAFGDYESAAFQYIVWNLREGMQRPGQWYWDKAEKVLYYWQLPGENIRTKKVVIPIHDQVISIDGAHNVRLKSFSIRSTTTPMIKGKFAAELFDAAISAENADGLEIDGVHISNISGWGIKSYGDRVAIRNCEIAHTGAGAIRTEGNHVTIENCGMHDIGEIYYSAVAVNMRGFHSTVSHNEIYNTSYSGLCIKSSDSIVEYNLIYNMMRELNDGAGIYFTFSNDYKDVEYNVLNYIENSVARNNIVIGGRVSSAVRAFYFDEYSRNCTFENNLSINAGAPVILHMALDCTIKNNIFVDRGSQRFSFARSHGITFEQNIAVADTIRFTTPVLDTELVDEFGDYTKFARDRDYPENIKRYATGVTCMKNNLFYSRLNQADYIAINHEWKVIQNVSVEEKEGVIIAEPGFKDIDNLDFSFTRNALAAKIGFEPIDFSEVGRRTLCRPYLYINRSLHHGIQNYLSPHTIGYLSQPCHSTNNDKPCPK